MRCPPSYISALAGAVKVSEQFRGGPTALGRAPVGFVCARVYDNADHRGDGFSD